MCRVLLECLDEGVKKMVWIGCGISAPNQLVSECFVFTKSRNNVRREKDGVSFDKGFP